MTNPMGGRQIRPRLPVSSPLYLHEMEVIDRAAALRQESRAGYIRRVAVREAKADLRRAKGKRGAGGDGEERGPVAEAPAA